MLAKKVKEAAVDLGAPMQIADLELTVSEKQPTIRGVNGST